MSSLDAGQVVQAVLIGLPSILLGYLVHRRSSRVDAISIQAGAVTQSQAGTAQIIEGLNSLIDNLQEDNVAFRDEVRYLTGRLDGIIKECDELKVKFNRLRTKYGENGVPPEVISS